ncbi:MAG: hypothetical protein OXH23_02250 [bacterium]|nr:hypothetical protein [bacterium]
MEINETFASMVLCWLIGRLGKWGVLTFTSCSALGLLRVQFVSMSGESTNAAAVESIDTEEELDRLVQDVLDSADTTLEELREQGKLGRFDTEQQRQAWHVLAGTGRL